MEAASFKRSATWTVRSRSKRRGNPALCNALLVLALVASSLPRSALALESKCSACVAVQHELMEILIEERPKGPLDMRNRLNSEGKREGKVIVYKESELRIIQILEGLCEKMKKYSLMLPGKEKKEKRMWMHGQSQATDHLKLIAEEQGKELKRWCDRMLELHEEEMAEMIREEVKSAYKEVPIILCRNITNNCKDEETYLGEAKRMAQHWPVSKQMPPLGTPGMPAVSIQSGPAGKEPVREEEEQAEEEKEGKEEL